MIKDLIFGVVGGLGLFLFGMGLMSDGLKQVAGKKLKKILESMTKNPLFAFLVGAGITALIQSSSATTVMVIGFINAGLLTLKQAICVIIGTNVGTTATAWLVSISGIGAFKITAYALPAIGLGFLLQIAGRSRNVKYCGQILLGFGLLFIGIGFMEDAFSPLEKSEHVHKLFITFADKPMLAILAGLVVTMLIQSSSASIAIIQLLAMGGAFGPDWLTTLNICIPFILGSNIGTTITAQLASLRTSVNAKRGAWAHTMFNVFGTVIVLPFIYTGWYSDLVILVAPWELGPETIAATIAVAHTIFNIVNSIIFLPLAGVLEIVVVKLLPIQPGEMEEVPVVLETHLLDTPVLALQQAQREILRMAETARKAVLRSIGGIVGNNRRKLKSVLEIEDNIDGFQYEITSYLSALSRRKLSDEVSIQLPVFLHTVNDLERIGDHAVNIVEIAQRKIDQSLIFSQAALDEIARLRSEAEQMFDLVIVALNDNNVNAANAALENEKNVNTMQLEFRRSHVQRMTEGCCTAEAGLIFIDLVDNVEKICDHLTNIAQAVIGGLEWDGFEGKMWSRL